MVRRSRGPSFASALVFPGGKVEPSDFGENWAQDAISQTELNETERALRIAGIRETFEETSLILAGTPSNVDMPAPPVVSASFCDALRSLGSPVDLDAIQAFSHWITPEGAPRRFDTHFFISRAPNGQQAIPDGRETLAVEWASPAYLIQRAREGERSILFPTLMNLIRLAESSNTTEAIDAARSRVNFTVLPRVENRSNGDRVVVIPIEAGYGLTEYPAT